MEELSKIVGESAGTRLDLARKFLRLQAARTGTEIDIESIIQRAEQMERPSYDDVRTRFHARKREEARRSAGLVGELATKSLESYAPTTERQIRAHALAMNWIAGYLAGRSVPGLLFYSPVDEVGVGKTHLIAAIGNRLIDAGHSCKFCSIFTILDSIRSTMDDKTSKAAVRRLYSEPGVILLDDIGKERPMSEWERGEFFNIVDEWIKLGTYVLATTNYTSEQLVARYEGPAWSRLNGLFAGRMIRIDGHDARDTYDQYKSFFGE